MIRPLDGPEELGPTGSDSGAVPAEPPRELDAREAIEALIAEEPAVAASVESSPSPARPRRPLAASARAASPRGLRARSGRYPFHWRGAGSWGLLLAATSEGGGAPDRSGVLHPPEAGFSAWLAERDLPRGFALALAERTGAELSGIAPSVAIAPSEGSLSGLDGGPGERSGLAAFLDDEELAAVVLPAKTFAAVAARQDESFAQSALAFARSTPALLVLAARPGPKGARTRRAGESPRDASLPANYWLFEGSAAEEDLLALVAWLAQLDLRLEEGRSPPPLPARAEARRAARELDSWWRRRGILRALEVGSRPVVQAPDHPRTHRHLEREARAFLFDLARQGVLPGGLRGEFDLRVLAGPGRVRIQVEFEERGEF